MKIGLMLILWIVFSCNGITFMIRCLAKRQSDDVAAKYRKLNKKVVKALQLFRESQAVDSAVPILIESVRSGHIPHDYVALEHIAAAFSMGARRLALHVSRNENSGRFAEEKALTECTRYFERGWYSYLHRNNQHSQRKDLYEYYPQKRFEQPRALILRNWGDCLTWLREEHKAKQVFKEGVKIGIWSSPLCRPMKEHAFIETFGIR